MLMMMIRDEILMITIQRLCGRCQLRRIFDWFELMHELSRPTTTLPLGGITDAMIEAGVGDVMILNAIINRRDKSPR